MAEDRTSVCSHCGGPLVPGDQWRVSGREMRSYRCGSCGTTVTEEPGVAGAQTSRGLPEPKAPAAAAEPGARSEIIVFVFGVVLLFGGAYLTYVSGYVPYDDALHGAPSVTLNAKSLMVGPLSVWLGLVFLASLLVPAVKPGEDPAWRKVLGIVVLVGLVLTAAAGAVAYFSLRAFLKSRGYDV